MPTVDTSNPFIARDIPSADESFLVIRFANPKGIDFPYLLTMLHDSFMSRPNIIVVPGGKMELAMQLIFTPMILQFMDRKRRAWVCSHFPRCECFAPGGHSWRPHGKTAALRR